MSDFFFIYIQLQNLVSETKLWEQKISSAALSISPLLQPVLLHSSPFAVLFAPKRLLSRLLFSIFLVAVNRHNPKCVMCCPCWVNSLELKMLEGEEILPKIGVSALLIITFPLMDLSLSSDR